VSGRRRPTAVLQSVAAPRTTYFNAFDLIECDGEDLRSRPLIERKVDHMNDRGADLFRAVCANDLEGVVAKWKYGRYCCGEEQPPDRRLALHASNPATASRLTWLKIRNPQYSQVLGRHELFKARTAPLTVRAHTR
jgi:hypothetical protein